MYIDIHNTKEYSFVIYTTPLAFIHNNMHHIMLQLFCLHHIKKNKQKSKFLITWI